MPRSRQLAPSDAAGSRCGRRAGARGSSPSHAGWATVVSPSTVARRDPIAPSARSETAALTMHRSGLTPRMAALLERIERAGRPPFHRMRPDDARAAYEQVAEVLDLPRAPADTLSVASICRERQGARLAARWYRAASRLAARVLYLHGGGFTIGSLETHDSLCRQLALSQRRGRGGARLPARARAPLPDSGGRHLGGDALAGRRTARTLGLDGRGSRSRATAPAARWPRCVRCRRATPVCRCALQLLITPGTAAHADTASHRLFAQGFLLDAESIDVVLRPLHRPIDSATTGASRR